MSYSACLLTHIMLFEKTFYYLNTGGIRLNISIFITVKKTNKQTFKPEIEIQTRIEVRSCHSNLFVRHICGSCKCVGF